MKNSLKVGATDASPRPRCALKFGLVALMGANVTDRSAQQLCPFHGLIAPAGVTPKAGARK